MVCAVYTRKSNEQNGVADEAKSVTRQIEHAKAYAQRKGWTVDDSYIFLDDGISGAEFANRPGFVRLMNALKPKPLFQVLIMSEESRLGREMIETSFALKQIITAGVRVFYFMEDRERTLDSPTDKVLLAVNAYAGELEREMARQRSRDAALQRARGGFVTGGACFGYRNIRTDTSWVVREIDPQEAAIVRRIFELCAAGQGVRRIAKTLNREGAPAPRLQQHPPQGWAPLSVRPILMRSLYRGEVVWGKARKRNKWGQLKFQRRPEAEWLRASAPHMRVVDDELWNAAHERLRTSRENYLRHADGKLWGRPANGVESKYLLTWKAVCGTCGAGMLIRSRSHGKKRAFLYGCAANFLRGETVCPNDLEIPMEMADAAVLDTIEHELLTTDEIALALDKLMAKLDQPVEDIEARRAQIIDGLRQIEQELARFKAAIAAGGELATLLDGLKEREQRREHLRAERQALDLAPIIRQDARGHLREALRHLDEWRGLLGKHVAQSRQLLRKVLDGRLVFYPRREAADSWYEFAGTGSLAKFFSGIPALKAVASPRGYARVGAPETFIEGDIAA